MRQPLGSLRLDAPGTGVIMFSMKILRTRPQMLCLPCELTVEGWPESCPRCSGSLRACGAFASAEMQALADQFEAKAQDRQPS